MHYYWNMVCIFQQQIVDSLRGKAIQGDISVIRLETEKVRQSYFVKVGFIQKVVGLTIGKQPLFEVSQLQTNPITSKIFPWMFLSIKKINYM